MQEWVDLAAESLGGYALACNDDFFAPCHNLVKDTEAVWLEHEYVATGKWMDGWESRRRRQPGYDWCIVRLGVPGVVHEVVVDTAHFKGNYPEEASVEACLGPHNAWPAQLENWVELVPRSPLRGDHPNRFRVVDSHRFSHLRLNIFPDGGVARFRVYGHSLPDWMGPERLAMPLDLAAMENGGYVHSCSDMFFGDRQNLIRPGPSRQMNEGWETRRRRDNGNDWAVLRLACAGTVLAAEVNSSHFKGNAPAACYLEGARESGPEKAHWFPLLPRQQLLPHTVHRFGRELCLEEGVRLVRLHIYPDGGLARLRLWGRPDSSGLAEVRLRWLNALSQEAAQKDLLDICSSRLWAERVAQARPFRDRPDLFERAARVWNELGEETWLEAFSGHPRIGERKSGTERGSRWSAEEQGSAPESDLQERFASLNQAYEEKYGFVFLICATGKNATEMLAVLESRLHNDRATEVATAASEQARITALRLEKYLTQ